MLRAVSTRSCGGYFGATGRLVPIFAQEVMECSGGGERVRVLLWFCKEISWTPTIKSLDDVPDAEPGGAHDAAVAFIHVEPDDGGKAETKLVKNVKWLARKWETRKVVLVSFNHLGELKADADLARELLERAAGRLAEAGYVVIQTPYGYFSDLKLDAPGHPLARGYKSW